MGYNCSLIKVDWLAACIALRVVGDVQYWSFTSGGVGVNLHNLLAYGKQGPLPEEMSQTPLTNKKQ